MKNNQEYEKFDRTMRDLMKVPHEEIKAALNEEKVLKQRGKRKPKKLSAASDRAADKTD